jgi:hypothetical protein
MGFVFRLVRGVMNVTVSGILLLCAASMLFGMSDVPSGGFKGSTWVGALAILGAAAFTGVLTVVFWAQREGRRSYYSSAILNGLSTVAFLSVIIIRATNR